MSVLGVPVPVFLTTDRRVIGGSAYPVYIMGGSVNATSIGGNSVATTTPTNGNLLVWVAANNRWEPVTALISNLNVGGYSIVNYGNDIETKTANGAVTIDAASYGATILNVTGNITGWTLTWPTNSDYCNHEVIFKYDGIGGYTVDFTGFLGSNGNAPAIGTGVSAISKVLFTTEDGGTTVYADLIGANYGTI